jgi:hypothetical protein
VNVSVINQLVYDYIDDLYFSAHHLSEGLIVEPEHAKAIIKENTEFIINNP